MAPDNELDADWFPTNAPPETVTGVEQFQDEPRWRRSRRGAETPASEVAVMPIARYRSLLLALPAAWQLAGCATGPGIDQSFSAAPVPGTRAMYGLTYDQGFEIRPVSERHLSAETARQRVAIDTSYDVGSIIVDTPHHFLYFIETPTSAIRYAIGVGRDGFRWSGEARIERAREWPTWVPPASMIERQPELVRFENGMPGGLRNPLGARALYLFSNGHDTLFRIHGTAEYWSIGRDVSSGCIRLRNHDIIDLYDRISLGAKVYVLPSRPAA
ncbi:MAG: L,D-transpeptidase [Hyphomicrobiaceae bacterium]